MRRLVGQMPLASQAAGEFQMIGDGTAFIGCSRRASPPQRYVGHVIRGTTWSGNIWQTSGLASNPNSL